MRVVPPFLAALLMMSGGADAGVIRGTVSLPRRARADASALDADGSFALPGLPAGIYRLIAWHPSRGCLVRRIEIPASGAVHVAMRF